MVTFSFREYGENLGTRPLGKRVREQLLPLIEQNSCVVLDFTGVNVVSNSFADECIAKLLLEMPLAELRSRTTFKVKSSAIKILTANSGYDLYFVYEYLQNLGLVSEEHKRHYISEIEPMIVACPTFEEQQNISKLLRSFDNKIECANRELTLYNKQKQYLLSQMFI